MDKREQLVKVNLPPRLPSAYHNQVISSSSTYNLAHCSRYIMTLFKLTYV